MRKAILVFLFVASICCQGMALAKQVLAWDRGGDASHSLLHDAAVAHHHHHDGSVHKDESRKSKQHAQADGCGALAGIPSPGLHATPPISIAPAPCREPRAGHDSPFLEGLMRPPRVAA